MLQRHLPRKPEWREKARIKQRNGPSYAGLFTQARRYRAASVRVGGSQRCGLHRGAGCTHRGLLRAADSKHRQAPHLPPPSMREALPDSKRGLPLPTPSRVLSGSLSAISAVDSPAATTAAIPSSPRFRPENADLFRSRSNPGGSTSLVKLPVLGEAAGNFDVNAGRTCRPTTERTPSSANTEQCPNGPPATLHEPLASSPHPATESGASSQEMILGCVEEQCL
jgi:hypothetical protein